MITLSNGFSFEECIASGALAFDCLGWPHERPLVWRGLIQPELCPVVMKTVTWEPRKGNLCLWKPWTWKCVLPIPGGAINKVGLSNPGVKKWCKKIGPRLDYQKYAIIGSIFGNMKELIEMAHMMNQFDFKALEVNYSCPNTEHGLQGAEAVIASIKAVAEVSRHPIIIKISVAQDYLAIAKGLKGIAEAISINSVPFALVFPGEVSPLLKLSGDGGGGVSGKPAQPLNWKATRELAEQDCLPVIGPGIMEYEDMETVIKMMGASAVSFGVIHLPTDGEFWKTLFVNPQKPTQFILRKRKENNR